MKKDANLNALAILDHATAAQAQFVELIERRIKTAATLAEKHAQAATDVPAEESEQNKAAILRAQVLGLQEALKLYEGVDGGVAAVEDAELQRVIFQARAQIYSRISQLTSKACYQAHLVWTTPVADTRHQKAKQAALKLDGRIEGYQYALEYFDKCFNDLEGRACLV